MFILTKYVIFFFFQILQTTPSSNSNGLSSQGVRANNIIKRKKEIHKRNDYVTNELPKLTANL